MTAVLDDVVYTFGGTTSDGMVATGYSLHSQGSARMPTADLPERSSGRAVTLGGRIYVIAESFGVRGSNLESTSKTTIHEYDPSSNAFTLKTTAPTSVWSFGAAVVDNRIYLIS